MRAPIRPFVGVLYGKESSMRPRRYRLRCYVFGVRSILWALNRLSDWEVRRLYPPA